MARHKIIELLQKPILFGSVTTAMSSCGNKNCSCHSDSNKLHGPYSRWSGYVDGKHTSLTISQKEAAEAKKRIKNYQNLKAEINKIKAFSLKNAPWVTMRKINSS